MWIKTMVSTGDGGHVLDLGEHGKCKVDEAGQFLWRVAGSGEGTTAVSAMPDGGVVTALNNYTSIDYDLVNDSIAFRFPIIRTDGAGDVIWSRTISIHFGSLLSGDPYVYVDLSTDTSGRIFLLAGCSSFTPRQEFIACLDASGALLWSRWIDDLAQGRYAGLVAADQEGGCFAVWKREEVAPLQPVVNSQFDLCHLTSEGSLDWHRRGSLGYSGYTWISSIISLNDGVVVAGRGTNFVEPQGAFAFRAGSDGTLEWRAAYDFAGLTGVTSGSWHTAGLANGEMIGALLHPGQANFFPVISHIAPEGSVVNSAQVVNADIGGQNYHVDLRGMDAHDTTIAFPIGLLNEPGIWSLTPELTGCMLTPVSVLGVLTSTLTSYEPDPSGTAHTAVTVLGDSATTVTHGVEFHPVDLCWYVTATPDLGVVGNSFHVAGSVVQGGMPIVAASATNGRIEVLDASGRLVAAIAMNPSMTNELPTVGWPAGLYLLRAADTEGQMMGTARVVVE